MAENVTFSYDPLTDNLDVSGISYANGSFRGIDGLLKLGGAVAVESRGGGVFSVTVPHFVARAKSAVLLKPATEPVVATTPKSTSGPRGGKS